MTGSANWPFAHKAEMHRSEPPPRSWSAVPTRSIIKIFIVRGRLKLLSSKPGAANQFQNKFVFSWQVRAGRYLCRYLPCVAGDPEDDPTILWPNNRTQVRFGTLTLSPAMPDSDAGSYKINFDPLMMADGIERPTIQFFCFVHLPMQRRTPEGCAICRTA
jgi:hypothetical protein